MQIPNPTRITTPSSLLLLPNQPRQPSKPQKTTHHHPYRPSQDNPRLPSQPPPLRPITRRTNIPIRQRRIRLCIIHPPTITPPATQPPRARHRPLPILRIRIIHNERVRPNRQWRLLRIRACVPDECLWGAEGVVECKGEGGWDREARRAGGGEDVEGGGRCEQVGVVPDEGEGGADGVVGGGVGGGGWGEEGYVGGGEGGGDGGRCGVRCICVIGGCGCGGGGDISC